MTFEKHIHVLSIKINNNIVLFSLRVHTFKLNYIKLHEIWKVYTFNLDQYQK